MHSQAAVDPRDLPVVEQRYDRVLAEFGLPIKAQIDTETKRSMRSCREKGYEKGRSILAEIGKEILSQHRSLELELVRGGNQSAQMTPIQGKLK